MKDISLFSSALLLSVLLPSADLWSAPFSVQVVDEESGRPVPLVELRTVHELSFFTDNAGVVAIDAPELIGRECFFHVSSPGYEMPKDGFGYRGVRFVISKDKKETIKIKRLQAGERLFRVTGAGLFAESQKAGRSVPDWGRRSSSGVFGSDSVHTSLYRGKLFWLWGDTHRGNYPLGNFKTTSAWSSATAEVEKGINLEYFEDDKGFVRSMAPFDHKGPIWLTALLTLKDIEGEEHLVARYAKIEGFLKAVEVGLCEFDSETGMFRETLRLPAPDSPSPDGHPFVHRDESGVAWFYCGASLPNLRLPATYEAWSDPTTWEVVRADHQLRDTETGEAIRPHHGDIQWNEHRQRYVLIFTAKETAQSPLGEIYYAESSKPEGPWRDAHRILTHDKTSFYNPKQHPYFAKREGRVIYFEGTYTQMFSGNPVKTPRYEYNQLLYRLDLANLPLPKATTH